MRASYGQGHGDGYSYNRNYGHGHGHGHSYRYSRRWPPSPSVEDETSSLARELPTAPSAGSQSQVRDGEAQSRGTVDQYPLIEEVEQPANDERRFVLLSDPSEYEAAHPRRKSFAERANIPYLHTDLHGPPLFAKRTPTPYAYTSNQKESLAPDPSTTARRDTHDLIENPDSDTDTDTDTSHLHTARRPARYSFVKSDLQKERLRENVHNAQVHAKPRSNDSISGAEPQPDPYTVLTDSPTSSSSSSLGGERTRTTHRKTDKPRSDDRPSPPPSPRRRPRPRPRPPLSPNTSRPSSSSGRPPSPLAPNYSQPEQSPRVPITETDWHATYPPRSRPAARPERYDTIPVPVPHINVKSPSPSRQRESVAPLPYPVDERLVDAFMPPEEQYQHDHSYDTYTPITSSPRLDRMDSPIPGTARERQSRFRPQMGSRQNTTDDMPLSPDRPLPPCPRTEPSSKYTDWYTMEGISTFDICPSCYQGVFADTPFARYFSQTRLYERPTERFCDFGSSPWMRLAWLLTVKQRRQSLDLLRSLAKITERERDCPGDRELGTDHITWYGISDPRDGIHVTNFAICTCDLRMVEELFPTMKGYFTRIPATTGPYALPSTYTCSLRVKSGRFPKYLGLLVELDTEAQTLNQHPHISRFVQLAHENAFKSECQREKPLFHKSWHFIPALPELTVCQECFEELIWPHLTHSSSTPSTIPRLFNRTIQPVPGENPETGSSCGLYSSRMRQIWDRAVKEEDFGFLEDKVLERKRAEVRIGKERRDILGWMNGLPRGTWEWEKAKVELKENEEQWKMWE